MAKKPTIGKQNVRIKVKSQVLTPDGAGGVDTSGYTTDFECWAETETISTKSLILQGHPTGQEIFQFKIRYSITRPLNISKVIEYKGIDMTITGIDEIQEGRTFYYLITANRQRG